MKQKRQSFSLIELLAVIAVIGILVGIGVGGYSYAMNSAKESATRSAMKQIEVALENMKTKYGYYPPCAKSKPTELDKDTGKIYIFDQDGNPPDSTNTASFKTAMQVPGNYMADFVKQLDPESLRSLTTIDNEASHKCWYLVDAWGNQIVYRCPGEINKESYDLISAGPDGRYAEFSKNWTVLHDKTYEKKDFRDNDNAMICDDLVNF